MAKWVGIPEDGVDDLDDSRSRLSRVSARAAYQEVLFERAVQIVCESSRRDNCWEMRTELLKLRRSEEACPMNQPLAVGLRAHQCTDADLDVMTDAILADSWVRTGRRGGVLTLSRRGGRPNRRLGRERHRCGHAQTSQISPSKPASCHWRWYARSIGDCGTSLISSRTMPRMTKPTSGVRGLAHRTRKTRWQVNAAAWRGLGTWRTVAIAYNHDAAPARGLE